MKIVLAIPAYNCGKQLNRVLSAIKKQHLYELFSAVIVIDNISPDDTLQVAQAFKKSIPHLHVFQNQQNYSLGGSHKVAFLYGERVGATHVAILHGDDQAVASEVADLVAQAKQHPEVDAVLGTRFMKGSRLIGYDQKRIWGNRVLNVVFTIVALRRTRDLGSGLNIFKLDILKDHVYLQFADRMTFNIELLLHLFKRRAKILYFPITWRESDQVSNARNFTIAKTAFANLMKWRFGQMEYSAIKKPGDYISKEY